MIDKSRQKLYNIIRVKERRWRNGNIRGNRKGYYHYLESFSNCPCDKGTQEKVIATVEALRGFRLYLSISYSDDMKKYYFCFLVASLSSIRILLSKDFFVDMGALDYALLIFAVTMWVVAGFTYFRKVKWTG